ncbi:MAG: helix-turn-helix domain-containing protein [Rhodospirillaceae bacterium]
MDVRKVIGWNLRRLRLKRGLSQEAVAGEQMDTAHVSRIERGVENPTVLVLDKLAKALGVKITEFFKPVRPGATWPPALKAGRKKSK